MWPSRPDMSRDECRKCLRCLELDAYGNMVSVLRAQGAFTDEKQKLLGELAKVLHISNERHRAEIRRAVNDEKLSVIAEQLNGPNTCTDWSIEGRRTIPLLPRLKAHTAFTGLANSLSLVIAAANEKKLPTVSRVEEPTVKAETESREAEECEERPKVQVLHSENSARGKKRKWSMRESPENDKCRKTYAREPTSGLSETTNSVSCNEERVTCPSPISSNQSTNVVQVSIVTPSSPADTPLRKSDNPLGPTQLTFSTTNASHNSKRVTIAATTTTTTTTTTSTASTTTSSSPAKTNSSTVQSTAKSQTSALTSTNRLDAVSNVVTTYPASAKSRATVTAIQTKMNSNVQQSITAQCTEGKSLQADDKESHRECDNKIVAKVIATVEEGPKISRPDSTTSSVSGPKRITTTKLCLTSKPVITSSTSPVVAVNSGSTASSGPGPPSVKISTLTHKKLSPGKLNHHAGSKMGITLSSDKTLKINAHPNARLASKANVIVVQKGSSRGVTLSHGGKEVLGKVIMGGKNLCLAGQKSATSVAILPHRAVSNNGDQSLAMLSTVDANHTESLKNNSKTGNMIVFDLRQEVLEKNKVLSQFLEASGVFNHESNTASIGNSNNNIRSATKNLSVDSSHVDAKDLPASPNSSSSLETQESAKTTKEICLYSSTEAADSSDATRETDIREILTDSEERIEMHGVLDAQTGIYNFETTDGTVIEDHVEESIPTSGLDIFSTALASADINLENFHYVNDEDDEIMDVTSDEVLVSSQMSTVEQLNEISDS